MSWVLLLLAGVVEVGALDPGKSLGQYGHRVFGMEDRLPHGSVRALVEDARGYLWLGTQAGLARFDGSAFRVYDRRSHPDMSSDHVEALAIDGRGRLWIGTLGGGLLRWADGRFRAYRQADGLPGDQVMSLHADAGGLWIGTYEGGLARLEKGRLSAVPADLANPIVTDITPDPDGGLWLSTFGGLHHYRGDARGGTTRRFTVDDGLSSERVWQAVPASDGSLWVATDRGLDRLRDGRFESYGMAEGLRHERVISVLEDGDGQVWAGTFGGGLHRLGRDGRFHGFEPPEPGADAIVWTLHEDREGNLWAGTLLEGVHQLEDGAFTTWGESEGLSSNLVDSIAEDAAGGLWLATRNAGLNRLRDGRAEPVAVPGLPRDLWSVSADAGGDLWVGTSRHGLHLRRDGVWRSFGVEDGLAPGPVFVLEADGDGGLWAGANGGLSHLRPVPDTGGWTITTYTSADGLPGDQVRALHRDRRGRLWVGTTTGLARFGGRGQGFETYTEADGLASGNVVSIWEDPRGVLWLGTVGGGLARFADGVMSSVTSADGLWDEDVNIVLGDGAGHLWVGGSRGVFRVAVADLEARLAGSTAPLRQLTFGRHDGLGSNVWGIDGSGLRDREGRLWFCTRAGVARVDPARVRMAGAPPVHLESVRIDGRSWPLDGIDPVPPGAVTVSFRFAAPTLSYPEKVRLRYRLHGFDERWTETREREAHWNHLPPGRYRFELAASDPEGRWSGQALSWPFTVEHGPWRTSRVYVAYGLGLLLAAVLLHLLRLGVLARRERRLEAEVARTLAEVKVLSGMLPICGLCHKVRDDDGYWSQLEAFLSAHSEARFQRGLCSECAVSAGAPRAGADRSLPA